MYLSSTHIVYSIRRGIGYFCFERGTYQQFQLQMCKASIKCYITIHHSVQPPIPSDKLPVLLQQRRELLQYLQSSIAEISRSCMPSAEPPVTHLECPLNHEDDCVPHIPLDIDNKEILICHETLIVTHIPTESYILLFEPSVLSHQCGKFMMHICRYQDTSTSILCIPLHFLLYVDVGCIPLKSPPAIIYPLLSQSKL